MIFNGIITYQYNKDYTVLKFYMIKNYLVGYARGSFDSEFSGVITAAGAELRQQII